LTEEEAQAEDCRLFWDGREWTVMTKKRQAINDDELKYIRKYTSKM
jgi:hypothetical protein